MTYDCCSIAPPVQEVRLIDANALLAKYPDCRGLRQKVESMPTAGEVVKVGSWVQYGNSKQIVKCSRCGYAINVKHTYCSECGSKNWSGK